MHCDPHLMIHTWSFKDVLLFSGICYMSESFLVVRLCLKICLRTLRKKPAESTYRPPKKFPEIHRKQPEKVWEKCGKKLMTARKIHIRSPKKIHKILRDLLKNVRGKLLEYPESVLNLSQTSKKKLRGVPKKSRRPSKHCP